MSIDYESIQIKLDDLKERVRDCESAENELNQIRATLLVNFGNTAKGNYKNIINNEKYENSPTLNIMVDVLHYLIDTIEKNLEK